MARKSPPQPEAALQTGAYPLDTLRAVIKRLAEAQTNATISLPRSVAHERVPILSPNALRYIEFDTVPDANFPKSDTFVVEFGKKKFGWKR